MIALGPLDVIVPNLVARPHRGWLVSMDSQLREPIPRDQCSAGRAITAIRDSRALKAAGARGVDVRTLTIGKLIAVTKAATGRGTSPTLKNISNEASLNGLAARLLQTGGGRGIGELGGMRIVAGNSAAPPDGAAAFAAGNVVFLEAAEDIGADSLMAHEYMHVLQGDSWGLSLWWNYAAERLRHSGFSPTHRYESIGYLWEGYIAAYGNKALGSPKYVDNQPWCYFGPVFPTWNYCP